jgi:hypothetical protein
MEFSKCVFDPRAATRAKLSDFAHAIGSVCIDIFQPVGGKFRKTIEAEASAGKPAFTEGVLAAKCGAQRCRGCGPEATKHMAPSARAKAGLFFAAPSAGPAARTKTIVRSFSFRAQKGFVELTLRADCWGPKACIINHFRAMLGHPRTILWLENKAKYDFLIAHTILKKTRIYGAIDAEHFSEEDDLPLSHLQPPAKKKKNLK